MRDDHLTARSGEEYRAELRRIFRYRTNLFCYITIAALLLEVFCAFFLVRGIIGTKDLPGIIGGIVFSLFLLATDAFPKPLIAQKLRAFFFSTSLIGISVLAAAAHPDVIRYLGITLILLTLFTSALLLPWTAVEATLLSLFAIANFLWLYPKYGVTVNSEIFWINAVLLGAAAVVCVIVKQSETVMRRKDCALRAEIAEKNRVMMKELELATAIQSGLVPKSFSDDRVDVAVAYKPMLYMGGDYAKFCFPVPDHLLFVIADVTGHGVSAALLVNRIHAEIERLVGVETMPGAILRRLDDFINADFGRMGIYLSTFCGLLDLNNRTLVYSNYGHPPQILFHRANDQITLMEPQTFLMGIGMEPADTHQIKVSFMPGDRIILFTDGVTETKGIDDDEFGYERLKEFIKGRAQVPVAMLNEALIAELDSFRSGEQADDIFLLSIQIKHS